jgi:hypothetical protein
MRLGLLRSRGDPVLTYIANRKGGVHFDSRRNLTDLKPRRQRREIEGFLLDHGLLRVGHLSGPEFEVQSMAQALIASDWARELVRIAHSVAPEDFSGDPNELKIWTSVQQETVPGGRRGHSIPSLAREM